MNATKEDTSKWNTIISWKEGVKLAGGKIISISHPN